MKAKETVMRAGTKRQFRMLTTKMRYNYWDIDRALELQAEISFKAGFEEGFNDAYKLDKQEYEAGMRAGIREVVELAEKFLTLAEHGDYSNGNDAFGVDEGRVRARELLDQYRKDLAKLKEC